LTDPGFNPLELNWLEYAFFHAHINIPMTQRITDGGWQIIMIKYNFSINREQFLGLPTMLNANKITSEIAGGIDNNEAVHNTQSEALNLLIQLKPKPITKRTCANKTAIPILA
jgi:hypothetical protein